MTTKTGILDALRIESEVAEATSNVGGSNDENLGISTKRSRKNRQVDLNSNVRVIAKAINGDR